MAAQSSENQSSESQSSENQSSESQPPLPTPAEQARDAREALLFVVRRDPHAFGEPRSRWTLEAVGRACPWLGVNHPSSVWRVLQRLGVHYKRGRAHVSSPDPDYLPKLRAVRDVLQQALQSAVDTAGEQSPPARVVVLFEDEMGFNRRPTLAHAWAPQGHEQALAELGYRAEARSRVVGALNALTGQTHCRQHPQIGVRELVSFYQSLVEAYPGALIYLVQDNWPVHLHPDVLAALEPQEIPWPVRLSKDWPSTPSRSARRLELPIRLLLLPTYASWCNPIEKLWRLLRQELLHMHHFADDWSGLRQAVDRFIGGLPDRAEEILRYVGLRDPSLLYKAALGRPQLAV